jgi:outer membrane protein assembly factor BamB
VAALWAVNAIACVPATRFGPDRDDAGWRVYLGSPRHDAFAGESLAAAPQSLWHTDAGRSVRGSPAIGTSVIAVGTSDRSVVLLERATGQPIWRQRVPGPVAGGPLLAGDLLYVATQAVPDGRVLALRLKTGKARWRANTGGVTAPLALAGDLVVAVTDGGDVVALDAATGAQRWRRPLRRAARATPVPTTEGIAVATLGDSLYLLDSATGAVRAHLATPGVVLGTPASDGRRLFLATTAGRLLAVSLPTLAIQWERSLDAAVYGAPALVGDTLYALSARGTLWRVPIDAPDGARSIALGVPATAGPTPIAGGVLVAGVTGEVLLVDTASETVRWRTQRRGPIEEPPLVRNGLLIIVTGDGTVEALR